MKRCANQTCSAPSTSTYCSRRCQVAIRNVGHRVGLPDLRVDMDLDRLLRQRAEVLGITLVDLLHNIIETEVGYPADDELFPGAA